MNLVAEHTTGSALDFERSRADLLSSVTGEILEIGPGRGASFDHLPHGIDWCGVEPDAVARTALERIASTSVDRHRVINATAEQLPVPDASVDAVISSLVLCSVSDQVQSLSEIRRVLRPGGRFIFFEHIAARRGSLVRLGQTVLSRRSRRHPGSCDPARETTGSIEGAGFAAADIRRYSLPDFGVIPIPHIAGCAYR